MSEKIPFMPQHPMYINAYTPFQQFENLCCTKDALKKGTIFKDLDVPFEVYKNVPILNPFRKGEI